MIISHRLNTPAGQTHRLRTGWLKHPAARPIALVGLWALLILLPALAINAAVLSTLAGNVAKQATQISSALDAARFAVGEEESLERKYRVEPSPEIRARHAKAAVSVIDILAKANSQGLEPEFARRVAALERRYLGSIGRMFDAIDAHDAALAIEIDRSEADPNFDELQGVVEAEAVVRREISIKSLNLLTDLQAKMLTGIPIALVIGGAVAGFFAMVLRAYRCKADDATRAETTGAMQRELRFRSLVQSTSDIILICAAAGEITYQSPAAETIWGYRPEAMIGQPFQSLIHLDDQAAFTEFWNNAQNPDVSGLAQSTELRLRNGAGQWRCSFISLTNLLHEPAVAGLVATVRDIEERKTFESELIQHAFYDGLTGLPNRVLFHDRLHQALARSGRRGTSVGLLFIDLDNFKLINDSLGHHVGDQLLIKAATRLKSIVQVDDTVARLGGDEFVVILENLASRSDTSMLAELLAEQFERPFNLADREVMISASIGIALSDANAATAEHLLRNADLAMYRAKGEGKARYVVFDKSMHVDALARLELEGELRHALAAGELRVHYQPIISMDTGVVTEVEALARWEHPTRGLVAPSEFIPIAEETGLILPLGQWILREACRQAAAWHRELADRPKLTLSVNLSHRQFQMPDLVESVAGILADTGFPPEYLKLEVTESVIMRDVNATIDTLESLKRLGVKIAIDDFGTGYSSLSYLKRLPLDVLKIDRSFIMSIGKDRQSAAIVRAILSMAQSLDLVVTAEGIETPMQASLLRAWGCDRGQGFLFSRPMAAAAATAFLSVADHARDEKRVAWTRIFDVPTLLARVRCDEGDGASRATLTRA